MRTGATIRVSAICAPDSIGPIPSPSRAMNSRLSASGVEASPGRKDPTKVRRFIEAARRAGEALDTDDWVPAAEPPYDWEMDA